MVLDVCMYVCSLLSACRHVIQVLGMAHKTTSSTVVRTLCVYANMLYVMSRETLLLKFYELGVYIKSEILSWLLCTINAILRKTTADLGEQSEVLCMPVIITEGPRASASS